MLSFLQSLLLISGFVEQIYSQCRHDAVDLSSISLLASFFFN
ncbi:hypothetical protein SynMVIR181_01040 [Synechococcus sp. MVIR-18-1]|nr:hypothetical protein SynMVIR181_01040 [Synechococcus sp. MVIR-18-1]